MKDVLVAMPGLDREVIQTRPCTGWSYVDTRVEGFGAGIRERKTL
jgi:hypothetical protein